MNSVARSLSQQGNVTLLTVLLMMSLASAVLRLTSDSLRYGAQQVYDEKNYLRAFYQAQSALAWGRNYLWSNREGWQCPQSFSPYFSVCFWRSSTTDGWLRGSSENSEWLLWQRVVFDNTSPLRVQRHPRGWIDDCPLSPELCRVPLPRDESR